MPYFIRSESDVMESYNQVNDVLELIELRVCNSPIKLLFYVSIFFRRYLSLYKNQNCF